MSFITKEIRRAWDKFRFWAWPKAVRRYYLPNIKSRPYRYPAVGSEPIDPQNTEIDYKTAYRDSTHNDKSFKFFSDPIGDSPVQKLVRYGFLKKDQTNNKEAIEAARTKYEKEIGESVDVRIHHDDLGFGETLLSLKNNREAMADFVANTFESMKEYNRSEGWLNDLNEVYHPQFYYLKTFDLAADDPVYRQVVIELEFSLERIANDRVSAKSQPVFKGDAGYWRILDDSFSEENIRKVQSSVRNYVGQEDLAPVHVGEGEIPPQKHIPAVRVPSENQFQ